MAPQNCAMPDAYFIILITRVTCVACGAKGSGDSIFRRFPRPFFRQRLGACHTATLIPRLSNLSY